MTNQSPMSNNPVFHLNPEFLFAYIARNYGEELDTMPMPGALRETFTPTADQTRRGLSQREVWAKRLAATLSYVRKNGYVTHLQADAICCDFLGVHPMQVFGMDWFTIDDAHNPLLIINKDWSAA